MPTILDRLDTAFRQAIQQALGFDADPMLSVSQNDKFGDYQANAAMSLAKRVTETTGEKTNPRAVAEKIKAKLTLGDLASEISIAGPGFINVRLSSTEVARRVRAIVTDARLGLEPVANPLTVVIDYSGPNVAKQMHVGHLRSTIIGDAISRVIEFQGNHVIRQNHIGDWGTQFGRVLLALWMRVLCDATHQQDVLIAKATAWRGAASRKDAPAMEQLVQQFAVLDQQFVDADPTGEKYFDPGLDALAIDLSELESLYQYVSGITDHPSAKLVFITHPIHGKRSLEELPRLVTRFLQNPSDPANAQERKAWKKSTDITLVTCQTIYQRLNVRLAEPEHQTEPLVRGESFYNDFLPAVVADLTTAGVATQSEGAVVVFTENHSNPLMIRKSDGGYLYGTTDLAAIRFRINHLKASRLIYTHDSRQAQHFAQVFATAKKAGWANEIQLEYAPFGTMLGEDGKPFKTRSGDTVKLRDLLDEAEARAFKLVTDKAAQRGLELPEQQRLKIAHAVGIAGIKYADLSKDRTSDYVFSWDQMLSTEGNSGPYLLYAYARIQSIFREAAARDIPVTRPFDAPVVLESPFELTLAKHILRLGEIIELVARELKPHHLCTYLYELATKYSGFYENCPVLKSEDPLRSSRLTLCEATGRTMALGLDLLGIEHPEQM
jgi:arginyl-tRNA synthetase